MRIVSTLIVRDEADIVGEHLRYHADLGVDFVVAIDHRSTDGTTDILREHERAGRLHLIQEQGDVIEQQEWVTRMARLAATDFGADWVLNCDVDEFWWPRDGSLRDVLSAVPRRFGTVRGWGRHFVARPETGEPFFERMTVRRRPTDEAGSPYRPGFKTAHRATPDVVVTRGNHNAFGPRAGAASRLEVVRSVPLPDPHAVADGAQVPAPGDEPRRSSGLPSRTRHGTGDPSRERR